MGRVGLERCGIKGSGSVQRPMTSSIGHFDLSCRLRTRLVLDVVFEFTCLSFNVRCQTLSRSEISKPVSSGCPAKTAGRQIWPDAKLFRAVFVGLGCPGSGLSTFLV